MVTNGFVSALSNFNFDFISFGCFMIEMKRKFNKMFLKSHSFNWSIQIPSTNNKQLTCDMYLLDFPNDLYDQSPKYKMQIDLFGRMWSTHCSTCSNMWIYPFSSLDLEMMIFWDSQYVCFNQFSIWMIILSFANNARFLLF